MISQDKNSICSITPSTPMYIVSRYGLKKVEQLMFKVEDFENMSKSGDCLCPIQIIYCCLDSKGSTVLHFYDSGNKDVFTVSAGDRSLLEDAVISLCLPKLLNDNRKDCGEVVRMCRHFGFESVRFRDDQILSIERAIGKIVSDLREFIGRNEERNENIRRIRAWAEDYAATHEENHEEIDRKLKGHIAHLLECDWFRVVESSNSHLEFQWFKNNSTIGMIDRSIISFPQN